MSTAIIQIQLEGKEIAKAHELAREWGFSSGEEALREFVKQFLKKKTATSPQSIKLTEKARLHYKKMDEDFKKGKNVHIAKDIDEFLAQLNA